MNQGTRSRQLVTSAVFALVLFPALVFAQEQPIERGSVEFGVRYVWGDVYGRPDLQIGPSATANPATQPGCLGCGTPFDPLLKTSKYNEYRDLRNGFFVRRFNGKFDDVLGTKNYLSLQSQRTLYRDQSYLATFGQYGRLRIQFRYDEIPHTYSDTVRTLFTETSPGVWSFPASIRQTLQGTLPAVAACPTTPPTLACFVNSQVVPSFNFLTPSIIRKGGTASISWDATPSWNINGMFWRESENGVRPIGLIMNSVPSAAVTGGYGVELPESISYFNNLVRVGAEYWKQTWAVQAAYIGSFFENNVQQMVWDNPFRLTNDTVGNPTRGRRDQYPDNQAHYLSVAGAKDLGKYARIMASVSPGWLRQNEPFLPYTINTGLNTCGDGTQPCTSLAVLPALSANGSKQTLAMNYTLVTTPWKNLQFKAVYRHYDYNNHTPVLTFTPVEGDAACGEETVCINNLEDNGPKATSFNRKNLEVTGNWYFAKRSSLKVGYEGEWMDRSHRDVDHSLENSVFGAVDVSPTKDVLFRVSYRHSDRKPDLYRDIANAEEPDTDLLCTDTSPVFTEEQRCHRRFDEAARIRDRADGLLQYNATAKLSLSAFGGVVQDDYNQQGGTNSPTPLNFITGSAATTHPYFLYGILKDISYNYGGGLDYAVSAQLTVFGEYSHEQYYRRLISRNRSPVELPTTILTCSGCDSANNDWESVTPEDVDIWTAGADTYLGKKAYLTTYYSLAAGRANTFSRFLGDPTIKAGSSPNCTSTVCPDRFTLLGSSAALDYPTGINRQHEVVAVFKYKLTNKVMPKLEYRYQQIDNKDPQTTLMTPYMGCMSPSPTSAVPGCPVQVVSSTTSPTPILSPNGRPSPFYPGFAVGDNSAARYLFLGSDQPSFRAHYLAATMEFHF